MINLFKRRLLDVHWTHPMLEFKLKFVIKASMLKLLFVTITPLSSGSNGPSSSHKSG